MGMSVCHRALAVNPQDADSVDYPREKLVFSDAAVSRPQTCSGFGHVKKGDFR